MGTAADAVADAKNKATGARAEKMKKDKTREESMRKNVYAFLLYCEIRSPKIQNAFLSLQQCFRSDHAQKKISTCSKQLAHRTTRASSARKHLFRERPIRSSFLLDFLLSLLFSMQLQRGLYRAAARPSSAHTSGVVRAASTGALRAGYDGASLRGGVCAVLGSQWGDEGKGKLSDLLASRYDVVARFNGGANAGHTVVANGTKFAFHQLPCGVLHPGTVNLIGNGCVVHVPGLLKELEPLKIAGIDMQGRIKISDRATILFDFHKVRQSSAA